jgi:hypothetical protein
MGRRGRPAKVAADGTRRKTIDKGDGRVTHQMWLTSDAGSEEPTATYREVKNRGRRSGRQAKLTSRQVSFLRSLLGGSMPKYKQGYYAIDDLRERAGRGLPDMSAVEMLLTTVRTDKYFPEDAARADIAGIEFVGAPIATRPGEQPAAVRYNLAVAILQSSNVEEVLQLKQRLLAELREQAEAEQKMAAHILAIVHATGADQLAQGKALVDFAYPRTRRKPAN